MPNRYDSTGRLSFDWRTLRDHAGQGPCRYWVPFSNAMQPHDRVPDAGNPDYEPDLDHRDLADYLITSRGFRGRTSLTSLEAVINGDSPWQLAGGPVAYALGAHVRRENFGRTEYANEAGPRGGALQNLDRYPCRGGPTIADCTSGRAGVFIYLPLTDDLNAQLSLRYEHYYLQGLSSLDPRVALRWQAWPSLTLRVSAGTAFRAPTINQIEPGIATTSRQFIGRIGTFKPIRALGNPDLDPEAVASFNAGAIFDYNDWRTAGDRVFLSVDFWRYAFANPLVLEPYVRVLDIACPVDETLCPAGSIGASASPGPGPCPGRSMRGSSVSPTTPSGG